MTWIWKAYQVGSKSNPVFKVGMYNTKTGKWKQSWTDKSFSYLRQAVLDANRANMTDDERKAVDKAALEAWEKSRQSNGLFSSSPSDSAKELARDFHGRDNKGIKEYTLASYYPKDLAELGILIELQVFTDDDREAYVPINFAPEHPDLTDDDSNVILAANGNRKQLYLVGGDQEYDLTEFAEHAGIDFPDDELEKDEVVLGEVKAIAYFADKHHLEGPKEQKTGIPYQHEFAINEETGEQIGEYPTLVYSQRDKNFKLVGGSYEILPEGISG